MAGDRASKAATAIDGEARHRSRQCLPGRPRPGRGRDGAGAADRDLVGGADPADGQLRRLQSRSLRRRARSRSPTISPTSSASPTADPTVRLIGQALIRRDRRGRLSPRRPRRDRRAARRAARSSLKPTLRADPELRAGRRRRPRPRRMPRHPAPRARPLRPGDGGAARQSRPRRQARPRRAAASSAASTTRISPRCSPRSAPLNPKPGNAFGDDAGAAGDPRRAGPAGARRRLARRAQFRHAAAGAGQPDLLREGRQGPEERQGRRLSQPTACRPPTGWSRASTSGPAPSSRSRPRSSASRTASSPMASSICGRSTSRPSPTRSACTNRRSPASPRTSTWRPRAASSR